MHEALTLLEALQEIEHSVHSGANRLLFGSLTSYNFIFVCISLYVRNADRRGWGVHDAHFQQKHNLKHTRGQRILRQQFSLFDGSITIYIDQ